MKIGIITKIGKNYGAVLQAYALKKACEKMGNESHIIKYVPDKSRKTYHVCQYPWGPRGSIANIKALTYFSKYKSSSEKFLEFREKNFDFIGDYYSYDMLCLQPPECDIYISGSDQVWNPEISFDKAFYFSFIENENKKLTSYAASIGLKKIPDSIEEEFKSRLEKFDYISVRERQAKTILSNMGIESVVTPDPTLLFSRDEWNKMAKCTIKGPYILCYFVSFPKGIDNIVNSVKKRMGKEYTVVNLMSSEESSSIGDIKIRDAGPEEFLGLFKNASYVITSSFHGTVFSIINRKPFMTTLYSSTSSRVTELLDTVGLSDRIVTTNTKDIDKYFASNIYTDLVETNIDNLRTNGKNVLKDILKV